MLAGLALFALDRVRLAGVVLAAGLGLAALLRLVLPTRAPRWPRRCARVQLTW